MSPNATLFTILPPGSAPDWVQLVPGGTFRGRDGRGPYRLADADEVIRLSMAGGKLPIDENHATDFAMVSGQPSPARGWIVEMEKRDDGIWGRVEWTEAGRALMSDHAYRGISPVFTHAKDGTVTRVLRAALTNTPNLAMLETLHGVLSEHERALLPEDLFAVPGKRLLPLRDADHVRLAWDMVDRTDGLTAAERTDARRRILARAKALGLDTSGWGAAHSGEDMDITSLRTALGLPATADEAAVLAAVTAQRDSVARQSEELATLRRASVPAEQVVALQTQLDTLRAERSAEKATMFVDGAIKGGKPIVAVREQMIAQHIVDPKGAEALINGLPSIHAGGVTRMPSGGDGDGDEGLTAIEMETAKKMGIEPKVFAAHLKKRRAEEGRAA